MITKLGRGLMVASAVALVLQSSAFAQQSLGPDEKPWVGALYPDTALAQGHNDAAKALAMVDDNPIIRWTHRVWCETGYHNINNVGTNQFADPLPDPSRDLVSPNGFYYRGYERPMPEGGVQFMDNAWYFGTDVTGAVVVKTDAGLLLFDALTTPEDGQTQLIDQMEKAGLDPADITHIFIGHRHGDHTGAINLIRGEHAPDAVVVAGEPDAQWMTEQRNGLEDGSIQPGRLPENATAEQIQEALDRQLAQLPETIDISIPAFDGLNVGSMELDVGGGTTVHVVMQPGHTPGQISVIVPVAHDGEEHNLLVWSGNDQLSAARQYAMSTDFVRIVAEQENADAFINTHAYQGAMFYHLRQLKDDPSADNPLLMGADGVSRMLGVFADCQRAAAQRFEDGTWVSWD